MGAKGSEHEVRARNLVDRRQALKLKSPRQCFARQAFAQYCYHALAWGRVYAQSKCMYGRAAAIRIVPLLLHCSGLPISVHLAYSVAFDSFTDRCRW